MKQHFTSKLLFSFLLFCCCVPLMVAQDMQQINNSGFEQWEGTGNYVEPVDWSSFMNTECPDPFYLSVLQFKQVEESSSVRPESNGTKSARIYARDTSIWFTSITANGNLTTGRIYAEGMDLSLAGNKTKRNEPGFNHPFTATPDSLTIWVRNNCVNPQQNSYITAIIHNDYDYFVPLSGLNDETNAVGVAYSTFQNEGNIWKRLSIPFDYDSYQSNDPHYILMFANTNTEIDVSVASGNDEIFIDDILMIYNPTVSLNDLSSTSYTLNPTTGAAISIPFTLTGTMSPNNLNADPNTVIAQLSDENGNFDNPIVLGSLITNESGVINGTIPDGTTAGNGYRVRVVTTNYPMVSEDNGSNLTITYPPCIVNLTANPSAGGTVSGGGTFDYGTTVTIIAVPASGYNFANWTYNGNQLSTEESYSFEVLENMDIVANFNEIGSFYVSVSSNPTGSGDVSGEGNYPENSSVTVSTTPNYGYSFSHWTKNNESVSTDLEYTFIITENSNLVANYTPNTYSVSLSADPITGGTVYGGGNFEYGTTVTISATPYPEYLFKHWIQGEEILSTEETYSFILTEDVELVGTFVLKIAVNEEDKDNIRVYSAQQNIVIESSKKNEIFVFNLMGQMVYKTLGNKGTTLIPVRDKGIYIVRINEFSKKIFVGNE